MAAVLIVYASTHGHTGKIASRIADAIRAAGADATVLAVGDAGGLRLADFDAVVVGASIHAGHHQRELVDWARHHAAGLNGMPSAFFSVCLAVAEDSDEARTAARGYVDDMLELTGWTPREAVTFAGALQYREYDFMTRLAMRLMMQRGGHPTDISRDYDYTDWDAVERFGRDCAALGAGRAAR
jgi:menaquinone-dependent protoporphyrinogen oxidase